VSSAERSISPLVELADWYEFRKAAYSLSFDDGLLSHYQVAAPILDKYSLNATFYSCTESLQSDSILPPTRRFGYWWQFIAFTNKGYELGLHTADHPKLTTLKLGSPKEKGTLLYERKAPIAQLKKQLPTHTVISFAYTFVDFNAQVKEETAKVYVSARGLGKGLNEAGEVDWMNIQAHTIDYSSIRTLEKDQAKTEELERWIEKQTISKGGWTV